MRHMPTHVHMHVHDSTRALFRLFLVVAGDVMPLRPLDDLLPRGASLVLVKDVPTRTIYNAFMAAAPHHPFIEMALNHVIDNIRRRAYGWSPLAISGPDALGAAMANYSRCHDPPEMLREHGIYTLPAARSTQPAQSTSPLSAIAYSSQLA